MCSDCGTTTPSEFKTWKNTHYCDHCWVKLQKTDPGNPYVIYTTDVFDGKLKDFDSEFNTNLGGKSK